MKQNSIDWTEAYLSLPRDEGAERKKKEAELLNSISNSVFGKDFKDICEQNSFDIDKYNSVIGFSAVVVICIKKGRHIELTENLHRLLTHFGGSPDFCEKCKKETATYNIGNIGLLSGCGFDFIGSFKSGYDVCLICGSVERSLFFKILCIPVVPTGEFRVMYEHDGRFIARKLKKQTYKREEENALKYAATLDNRGFAFLVDIIAMSFLQIFAMFFLVILGLETVLENPYSFLFINIALWLGYFYLGDCLFGKTIGKLFLKLKLMNVNGTKPSGLAVMKRALIFWTCYWGYDKTSETVIVEDEDLQNFKSETARE